MSWGIRMVAARRSSAVGSISKHGYKLFALTSVISVILIQSFSSVFSSVQFGTLRHADHAGSFLGAFTTRLQMVVYYSDSDK